jgi:simple sugar transport system permease protein
MDSKARAQLIFLVGMNVLVLVAGGVISRGTFVDPYNLQSMASQLPEVGLLAMGVMLAMCSGNGGIDLSGIALANLSAVFSAVLTPRWIPPDAAPLLFTVAFIFVALLTALAGGIVNGLLIARLGLTPILCTLGTQLLFTGLAVVLTGGPSVRVGGGDVLGELGNGNVFGVPISFLIFCAILLALGLVLKHTPFGVRLFLLGTNPKAARYAGIPQERILVATYATSGLLAGVAGVLIAARNVNVKWDYGQSYLLIAILIAVMAGVKPEGGYGRVTCLFLSTTVLQLLSSMLNFASLSNFFRDFAWGLLLLLSLAASRDDGIAALARRWRHKTSRSLQPPPAANSPS